MAAQLQAQHGMRTLLLRFPGTPKPKRASAICSTPTLDIWASRAAASHPRGPGPTLYATSPKYELSGSGRLGGMSNGPKLKAQNPRISRTSNLSFYFSPSSSSLFPTASGEESTLVCPAPHEGSCRLGGSAVLLAGLLG